MSLSFSVPVSSLLGFVDKGHLHPDEHLFQGEEGPNHEHDAHDRNQEIPDKVIELGFVLGIEELLGEAAAEVDGDLVEDIEVGPACFFIGPNREQEHQSKQTQ